MSNLMWLTQAVCTKYKLIKITHLPLKNVNPLYRKRQNPDNQPFLFIWDRLCKKFAFLIPKYTTRSRIYFSKVFNCASCSTHNQLKVSPNIATQLYNRHLDYTHLPGKSDLYLIFFSQRSMTQKCICQLLCSDQNCVTAVHGPGYTSDMNLTSPRQRKLPYLSQ